MMALGDVKGIMIVTPREALNRLEAEGIESKSHGWDKGV
jgi:hypothetical protein